MKLFALILFFCLISVSVFTQKLAWAKQMQSQISNMTRSYAIAYDLQGNIYTAGEFYGTVDFDPGAGIHNMTASSNILGQQDAFVCKYDSLGNFIWSKQFTGFNLQTASGVYADNSGNVYVTGYMNNATDFDPGSGVYNVALIGTDDAYVCKLDSSGNFLWVKTLGYSGATYMGNGITGDEVGNVYITGQAGNGEFDTKISPSGNFIWTKYKSAPVVAVTGRAIKYQKGNLYIAETNSIYGVITKWDTTGNEIWTNLTQGSGYTKANGIAVDSSGNVIVTGYFSSTVDFDAGPNVYNLSSTSSSDFDICVWKVDRNGKFVWARKMGTSSTENANGVATDRYGNIYIVGTYSSIGVDIDPGPGNFYLSGTGYTNMYICQLSGDGAFINAQQVAPTGNINCTGVVVDNHSNIYTTGYFNGTADFNPESGVYNMSTISPTNSTDGFDLKLTPGNSLGGTIYIDTNADGIFETTEPTIPFVTIKATQGTNVKHAISNSDGSYAMNIDTLTYTVSPDIIPLYYTLATPPQIAYFGSAIGISDTAHNFAVNPIPGINDLEITATYINRARPGRAYNCEITYWNKGTTVLSGTITFNHAPSLSLITTIPTYTSYSNNQLNWDYTSIQPNERRHIWAYFMVPTNTLGGTVLNDTLIANPVIGDTTPVNNTYIFTSLVRAAADPNEKTVLPEGNVTPSFVTTDTNYLDYTIRFQNTGTDTAFNIMVTDTLSSKVNISSFEMLASSHVFNIRMQDSVIRFIFNNIMLPDSTTNEALSHGYIHYRIKPLITDVIGDRINNKASILFDYNYPVVTNQTSTGIIGPCGNFVWTGGSSTNWTIKANWCGNLVPGPNDDVIIPAGTSFSCIIPAGNTVSCKSIQIFPGAILTLSVGSHLVVTSFPPY